MFILSRLVAAVASILPILFALQKGRNGDFDFIYYRTIDYTSSFQMPEVPSLLLPTHTQGFFAPVLPLMNMTNTTNAEPVTTQIDTQPAYLNVTAGPLYTTPNTRSVFHRYRQAALTVVDAWLGISKYILLVFSGVIHIMEDMKDFSAELLLHHHDFRNSATPRTRKALVIASKSLLWSFGRHVLPFSVIMAILVKLFVVISFLVSLGLGYYVYALLQALAKGKEVLKQQETTSTALRAHAETLERELGLHVKLVDKVDEYLRRHQRTAEQLRAHANTVQEDLDHQARLLYESQGDVKRHERTVEKLQAHADSLQQDLDQQKKLMEDQRVEIQDSQRSSNLQLKDSQAKIVSLEEESQAQLELHGRAQEKAQDEAQRSQAGLQAMDAAVEVQRQRAEKWKRQARAVDTKHSETTRRLDTLNVMYESLKKTLKGKTAEVEELSGERDGLARKAEAAEVTAKELRDRVEEMETDVVNHTSATISLNQQLRDSEGQVHETAAEMEKLNSVNKELSLKVMEAETRSQSLVDEVRQLKDDLSGKSAAVDESKLLAERHRSGSEQKAAEMVNLQCRLDEVSQEVTAAQLVALTVEERVKGLEGDLELKTSAVETLETQVQQERRSMRQATADLTIAETRLAALRQDNGMIRTRAEKLQERVSRLEQELDVKTSSVDAYERTSEHQELVLERRSAELAVALERVKSLEGDLKVLQAQLANTSHNGDHRADPPVLQGDDTDTDLVAEAEAQRGAQNAEYALNAQFDAPESQEAARRTEELEEAPARRRGHRSKRRRGGKRPAAKRRPLTRRHSFGSHAHGACSRCGGRLPVSVACIPQELQRADWRKPVESGMPVHKRRHSLDSLALQPCPECGGSLPVEVDVVSRAHTILEDDEASASSTGAGKRPQLSAQAAEPTLPGGSNPPLASPAFSSAGHTPLQDETSAADGAQEQGAGLPAGTSSTKTKRRRRQRAKGVKAQTDGELDSPQSLAEAYNAVQSPGPPVLSSRWGPG